MGYILAFCLAAFFALSFAALAAPFLFMGLIVVVIVSFCIGIVKGFGRYYQALVSVYGKAVGVTLGVVLTFVWLLALAGIVALVTIAMTHSAGVMY
ncbi:hypothetical protein [Bifidobacterium criceti]|uniref:Uncharacterized protein n=1 Tax=Bifidobacterium criceti TaxID=1960969 RepID=A0A2A2EHC8_9BIFI|nr:hypothetical protein [Bifidobacterium criceti]PAU68397.1 hypothetical protein B1526_0582 [Bifidobacterium criceti]